MRTFKELRDLLKNKNYYSDAKMTIEEIKYYNRCIDPVGMKNFKKNFNKGLTS